MQPLQPGDPQQVGAYRLLGRLGAGGMGQVFLGASPGGRKVAVKLVLPQHAADPEFRQRFRREVAAARQVGGFHTALVVDADPDADPPWMVTAYISGLSLDTIVRQNGPLDPAAARALGAALAEGLAAIHACGLVHRDLKPSNIIMAEDGPRIIDFGIARPVGASTLTASGVVVGTFAFMSPEQVSGAHVGPESDVFSLGSVLAYAATGRSPFDAPVVPAIIHRIVTQPADLGGTSGPLRDIISACLAKDPAARPSLADLLARLSGASGTSTMPGTPGAPGTPTLPAGIGHYPPTAPAPGQAGHRTKRSTRYRSGVIAAATAVVAAAAATVLALALTSHPNNGNHAGAGSTNTGRTSTASQSQSQPAVSAAGTTSKRCVYTRVGNAARQVSLPPAKANPSLTYTATLRTSQGTIVVKLTNSRAPCTVNSFVHLAEAGFYDNTQCHRLITSGIYILQCGDAYATETTQLTCTSSSDVGTGTPGYEFASENLTGATYPAGTVAMANNGTPASNGSQFFIVYRDSTSGLSPSYTPFGTVSSGLSIVRTVADAGYSCQYSQAGGGAPKDKIVIDSVAITKS